MKTLHKELFNKEMSTASFSGGCDPQVEIILKDEDIEKLKRGEVVKIYGGWDGGMVEIMPEKERKRIDKMIEGFKFKKLF